MTYPGAVPPLIRQLPDGRVAIECADARPDKDGVVHRWFVVDTTRGIERLTVSAMTDAEVADAVPMTPEGFR